MAWAVPREWAGARCFILAGGASLKGFDAARLSGRGRVIAIHEAGLTMAPWADVLYWSDPRWCDWNAHRLPLHTGQRKICRHSLKQRWGFTPDAAHAAIARALAGEDIRELGRERTAPLSADPARLAGSCSGGAAINLAVLFGATELVLLGYDMKPVGQWHDRHPVASEPNNYADNFIPAIEAMAPPLLAAGVSVVNATPGSALTCFPSVDLETVL